MPINLNSHNNLKLSKKKGVIKTFSAALYLFFYDNISK